MADEKKTGTENSEYETEPDPLGHKELMERASAQPPKIPPAESGVIKNAILNSINHKMVELTVRNYRKAWEEYAASEEAVARFGKARLEKERVRKLLLDANTIHKADAAERRSDLLRAQNQQEEQDFQIKMDRMERKEQLAARQLEHDRKMAELKDGVEPQSPAPKTELSPELQSFNKELEHSLQTEKDYWNFYKRRRADLINEYGSEDKIPEELRANLENIKRHTEQLIRDTFG